MLTFCYVRIIDFGYKINLKRSKMNYRKKKQGPNVGFWCKVNRWYKGIREDPTLSKSPKGTKTNEISKLLMAGP